MVLFRLSVSILRWPLVMLVAFVTYSCSADTNLENDPGPDAKMATYQNPILAGFYPDPTICQANDEFYLTTSTFSYFTGLPILRAAI